MTSRDSFIYNDNVYQYFDEEMKYNRAINMCKSEDGTLARHLDAAAYRSLSAYLSDDHQYWIGLSNRNELTCKIGNCFLWAGDQTCANVDLLQTLNQPNSERCQAVSVMWERHIQRNLPRANTNECTSKKRFICQYRVPTTTTMTTTSSTTPPFKYEEISSSSPNSTSNRFLTTSSSTASSFATGLIAALSITGLLILTMIILLCYYCTKKQWCRNASTQIDSSTSSENHKIKPFREKPVHKSSSVSTSAPPEHPQIVYENKEVDDSSDYVTANDHAGLSLTLQIRHSRVTKRLNDLDENVEAFSTHQQFDSDGYCNLSFRRNRSNSTEAIHHKKLSLPLYNPDERDGYATIGAPPTYVILDNPEAGKLEADANHHCDGIATHSKQATANQETIYLKPFN